MAFRTCVPWGLALVGMLASAAEPDYFPLQVGNQWVYRSSGFGSRQGLTMEVVKQQEFEGRTFYQVEGLGGVPVWLRMSELGTLTKYEPDAQRESTWIVFRAADKTPFPSWVNSCNPSAQIESKQADYDGPTGKATNALLVAYPETTCRDAWLVSDVFLPDVGLAQRQETSIGGPRTFDLVYARVGGKTVLAEKGVSFTLTLDKPVYTADLMPPVTMARAIPVLHARMTFANSREEGLRLQFNSGQTYEFRIRNEAGDVVYHWSADKSFTQGVRFETFDPGEKNWSVSVALAGSNNQPLPAGKYVAEAWLVTAGARMYAASVGFEIQHVF